MLKLKGCFWEGASATLEEMPVPLNGTDEDEKEEWQKQVTSALETLGGVVVEDGPPADNAFHVSQLAIIFNRIQPLLDTFATGLRDGIYDPDSSEYPTMTRFFAHLCLCLFLQMIEIHHRGRLELFWRHISRCWRSVLRHMVRYWAESHRVIQAAGQRELIAIAIRHVPHVLDLLADIKERRLALTRAREHGLDVKTVAIVTAERTIEKAFEHLPPLGGPLPSIIALQPEPSNVEMLLLRSIEWTSFMEATYGTPLEQVTVILRYFLGTRRVNLARKLLDRLPPEIAAISEPEDRATEYLHYRQFFNIWELLDRDAKAEWLKDYKGLIEQCYEAIVKLLTEDWMLLEQTADREVDRRHLEMLRVRQIYVPELILRLHVMLYSSREHIPGFVYYRHPTRAQV
ncbi:nuclear pore protein 84/107 [Pisolithus orientalis]|uniref:nuclear pore protein 84/107 n=1 Tax=Pisolithus orientalis TaxID=936130 RepID=UPI002225A09D|nr:nuclear pore protein 84/107 [Pisolithus orientalis]KAI6008910.1 nuclear pore protein 84/107 [Pisolithus orientalis]